LEVSDLPQQSRVTISQFIPASTFFFDPLYEIANLVVDEHGELLNGVQSFSSAISNRLNHVFLSPGGCHAFAHAVTV
jgi:hypothetical protein